MKLSRTQRIAAGTAITGLVLYQGKKAIDRAVDALDAAIQGPQSNVVINSAPKTGMYLKGQFVTDELLQTFSNKFGDTAKYSGDNFPQLPDFPISNVNDMLITIQREFVLSDWEITKLTPQHTYEKASGWYDPDAIDVIITPDSKLIPVKHNKQLNWFLYDSKDPEEIEDNKKYLEEMKEDYKAKVQRMTYLIDAYNVWYGVGYLTYSRPQTTVKKIPWYKKLLRL